MLSEGALSLAGAGFGPVAAGVPLWEVIIALGAAAALIAVAVWRPPSAKAAVAPESDAAALAVIGEIQDIDRILSPHANGVLTLSAAAAGAFATVVQTNGGPGAPLGFATTVALLTGCTLAAVGFALEARVTGAAALPSDQLCRCVEHNLRRAHRRAQCVRAATWCLFPVVLLVAMSIAAVRR